MFRNIHWRFAPLFLGIALVTPFAWADDDGITADKLDLSVWNGVQQTLGKPVNVDFKQVPLKDAVAVVGKQLQLPIALDEKALKDADVALDSRVTLQLSDKSARSALRSLLHDLQLTYIIRKDGVLITTEDVADTKLEIWTEDVSDLAAMNLDLDFEQLVEVLQNTIKPTTWEEVGGSGTVTLDDVGGVRGLVFKQTLDVHEEVNDFLALYRRMCRLAKQRSEAAKSAEAVAAGKVAAKDVIAAPTPFATLLEPDPRRDAIRNALSQKISLNYVETPLKDAVASLRQKLQIPVVLDLKPLGEMGVTEETPVTCKIANVTAEAALKFFVAGLGLTHIVEEESLLITSPDVADQNMATHVFEITDLVGANDATQDGEDTDTLTELITQTVRPTTWDEVGGSGSLVVLSISDSRFLVVSQTQDVQQEILDLVTYLRTQQHPLQPMAAENSAGETKSDGNSGAAPLMASVDRPLSARWHEKIRQSLEKPITINCPDTPLEKIVEHLQKQVDFPIDLDLKALSDIGVAPETPLDVEQNGASLRQALDGLLAIKDVAWTVRDDMILITSKDVAEQTLETRVYDVYDLPAFRRGDGKTVPDYEQLILAITKSIDSETWDEVGGPCSIKEYDAGGIQALVVSQTYAAHERILILLEGVRKLRKWPLTAEEIERLPPAPPPQPKPDKSNNFMPRGCAGGGGMGMF